METEVLSKVYKDRTIKERALSGDVLQKQLEYMLAFEVASLKKYEHKNLQKLRNFSQTTIRCMFDIIL